MFRLTQITRNLWIRLEGLFGQIFDTIFGWFKQIFSFLSKLFGFTESRYFLEDSAQSTKSSEVEADTATPAQYSPSDSSATRRRPDSSMDYYMKMARQEKKRG